MIRAYGIYCYTTDTYRISVSTFLDPLSISRLLFSRPDSAAPQDPAFRAAHTYYLYLLSVIERRLRVHHHGGGSERHSEGRGPGPAVCQASQPGDRPDVGYDLG